MSEQTPDHTDSAVGEAEPSMEDILASIRKIIADDADPVPLDGPAAEVAPLDTVDPLDGLESLIEDVDTVAPAAPMPPEPMPAASASLDSDPLDIDALLSSIDVVEPEAPPVSTSAAPDAALTVDFVDDPLVDLEIPMMPEDVDTQLTPAPVTESLSDGVSEPASTPDPSATLDALLGGSESAPATALGARAAQSLLGSPDAGAAAQPDEADDLDALMDDLLVELDAPIPDERVIDPAEALLAEDAADDLPVEADKTIAPPPSALQGEDEMDLVRSLMDDLTDEDVATTADADSDILDDILDMTLEDEIAEQALDIPEPEPEPEAVAPADPVDAIVDAMPVPDIPGEDAVEAEPLGEGVPSLEDIAAAASADADALAAAQPPAAAVAVGAASAALAGGAVLASADPDATEAADTHDAPDAEPMIRAETSAPTPPTEPSQQETPMPRAVRSDAILDEVTEEAATSAFAELNQVVEEKAVFNERGPRIGDLVQEALKPMLKEWLDANLKGIVERAVAKEVKRISSGK